MLTDVTTDNIALIKELIEETKNLPHRDKEQLDAILRKAEMYASRVFNDTRYNKYAEDLKNVRFHPSVLSYRSSNEQRYAESWSSGKQKLLNLFNTMLTELSLSTAVKKQDATSAGLPLEKIFDSLQLHKDIVNVSKQLFLDEHYASAVLEAFKFVNNAVKKKSNINSDGSPLMSSVFRKDNPILKLNALHSDSDKDEQNGFMYLFMGAMMGIRNPKAHENIVLNDPHRALHYLAFASLLRIRVDEATLSKSTSTPKK